MVTSRRGSSSRSGSSRDSGRSSGRSAGSSSGRGSFRGEEGMRRATEELERQKALAEQRKNQVRMPFRFYVKVGETKEAIVLDDKPDFFRFEHNMKGPDGKWNVFTGCVKDFDNCPVCEKEGRESYYAMYLTVLDPTEFETRDGGTVEFSRKLLVVKPHQQKKFMRFYEKEGTLRGAVFEFTRDGDKDSSIGNDIEFVDWEDEDVLADHVREWTDKDRKKHTEDCSVPFDYEELFEEPDTDQLAAQVGGRPAPGSRREQDRELGERRRGSSRRGRDDDAAQDESPARGRSARGRTRDAEQEEAPARGRGRGRPESKDMEEWEDPEKGGPPWNEAGDDEQDEPPARGRGRGRGRTEEPAEQEEQAERPRRGRGRSEPEPEQEERPRRGRGRPEPEPEPEPRRVRPRARR